MRCSFRVLCVHAVNYIDIGRRLVNEALSSSIDDQSARVSALPNMKKRFFVRRTRRWTPPGILHQIERGAQFNTRLNGVPGIPWIGYRPFNRGRRREIFFPHFQVVGKSTRGQNDPFSGPDPNESAVFHRNDTFHAPVFNNQLLKGRSKPQWDMRLLHGMTKTPA